MLKKKHTPSQGLLVTAGVVALVIGTSALAQDADPNEKAVENRQAVLKLVGWSIGPLGAMARGRAPVEPEVVGTNATRISALMEMMPDAFARDTRGSGVDTKALDGIWDNMDDFNAKSLATLQAADAVVAAAATEDETAIKTAIGKMARTCGSCHDEYKAD